MRKSLNTYILIAGTFLLLLPLKRVEAQTKRLSFIVSQARLNADERLFDVPDEQLYLDLNNGVNTHTSITSIGLMFRLTESNNKFTAATGALWRKSKSRFTRPFDHTYKNDGESFLILLSTNDYRQSFLSIPTRVEYHILDYLSVVSQIDIDLRTRVRALNTNRAEVDFSWNEINLNNIRLSAGLGFSKGLFSIYSTIGLINYQKFDPIIFNNILGVENNGKKFEYTNPFIIELQVGINIF